MELIAGRGGVFDVRVTETDTLVFSKHAHGRFPKISEALDLLADHMS